MRRGPDPTQPGGMTLHVVPLRPTRRTRSLALLTGVALAAAAAVVAALLSGSPRAAAGPAAPAVVASATPTGADGVDPELVARFAAAQRAAAQDGVTLRITSGRRSVQEQQQLVDEAVTKYGSVQDAHRFVLPPDASAHVQGLALDVGPTAGARWLGAHGLEFGLCRTYANETWHFEKLPAGRTACPPMHPDSSWGW